MGDDGTGSRESIPLVSRTDADQERAYLEWQLREHTRLKKIFTFFRKTDDLESSIYDVVKSILDVEPKQGTAPFEIDDVSDMIDIFCQTDQVLLPQFLRRTPFPFHMLRISLALHFLNPVDDSLISNIRMTEDENRNQGLKHLIWFSLFMGATTDQVESNLAKHRAWKLNANASPNMNMITPPSRTEFGDRPSPSNPQPYSQDARARPHPGAYASQGLPFRSPTLRGTTSARFDDGYVHGKKGGTVDSYFKDRRFSGAPEQSVDNLIRDYEICTAQQCLEPSQMSLFFVNALADPARQFFLTHCSPHMNFEQIAALMREQYNSETTKLQLQSEMDSLDISTVHSCGSAIYRIRQKDLLA